jgi:hypothetical protein
VNTDELALEIYRAERRVLEIQTKLHRWSGDDPHRRFDDLYNLITDSGFLLVAWDRVRNNRGARTAGVDGNTARYIAAERGVAGLLAEVRADLKARTFRPLPVRRHAIPKAGGKVRYLGIATIRHRVVQASLKLVLEPIFEADFLPCSYGFRPNRRAHGAVNSEAGFRYRWGGHGESLRRNRGDAAGVKLGTCLIDRVHSERGNRPRSPFQLGFDAIRATTRSPDPSLPGSCETPRVSTGFLAKGGIGDPCVRVHLL